jgi:23S rRNA pseudouridine1911/1915/1917 synthase
LKSILPRAQSSSFEITTESGRLDSFLSKATGKSRTFVQEQIKLGRVLINGKPPKKASDKLRVGDKVTADFEEKPVFSELTPIAFPLDILFEDKDLLVLNKPQGLVVHPASGHKGETLIHYLLHHLKDSESFLETSSTRPGLVHRLDRGTTGVILIAKTREIQEALSAQFKSRKVEKIYEAIVWGKMKPMGTMKSNIGRDRNDRKKMSSRTAKGREAVTRWQALFSSLHFTHVELYPKTGRTHQLRVQLTEALHPIVGDDLYGVGSAKKRAQALSEDLQKQVSEITQTFLHAKSLAFSHPTTGENMVVTAPRPEPFDKFLSVMRSLDC